MKSKAIERFKTALAIVAGATAINLMCEHLPKERQRITNIVYMGDLTPDKREQVKDILEDQGHDCEEVQFYDEGEVKEALKCIKTP